MMPSMLKTLRSTSLVMRLTLTAIPPRTLQTHLPLILMMPWPISLRATPSHAHTRTATQRPRTTSVGTTMMGSIVI